jgi:hypothetical protein
MAAADAPSRLVEYFCVCGASETAPLAPSTALGAFADSTSSSTSTSSSPSSPRAASNPRADFLPRLLARFPEEDHGPSSPLPLGIAGMAFPLGFRLRRAFPSAAPLPDFFTFVMSDASGKRTYGHTLVVYEEATPAQVGGGVLDPVAAEAATADGSVFHVPKALTLLSRVSLPEFRTALTELYRVSLSPGPLPLERHVQCLASLVPLPPPGRLQVSLSIGAADLLLLRRPPRNRRISPLNLPVREVLECLSPSRLVLVFHLLLVEAPVILVSSQLSLLTAAAETLTALLFPFAYPHPYIPVLPAACAELIQMPTAFLVGLEAGLYARLARAGDIPPTAALVFLDRDAVVLPPDVAAALPPLPARATAKLLAAVRDNGDVFGSRGEDWAVSRLPTFDGAFTFAAMPCEGGGDAGGGGRREDAGEWGVDGEEEGEGNVDREGGPGTARRPGGGEGGDAQPASFEHGADGLLSPAPPSPSQASSLETGVGHGGGAGAVAAAKPSGSRRALSVIASSLLSAAAIGPGALSLAAGGSALPPPTGSVGAESSPPLPAAPFRPAALRAAFFRFIVWLIGPYRDFLVADSGGGKVRIDSAGFLASASPDARPVLEALLSTQLWADFMDARAAPSTQEEDDMIVFLDESIDAKRNRSALTLVKRETPFLEDTSEDIVRTFVAQGPDGVGLPGYPRTVYAYERFPTAWNRALFSATATPPRVPGGDAAALAAPFVARAWLPNPPSPGDASSTPVGGGSGGRGVQQHSPSRSKAGGWVAGLVAQAKRRAARAGAKGGASSHTAAPPSPGSASAAAGSPAERAERSVESAAYSAWFVAFMLHVDVAKDEIRQRVSAQLEAAPLDEEEEGDGVSGGAGAGDGEAPRPTRSSEERRADRTAAAVSSAQGAYASHCLAVAFAVLARMRRTGVCPQAVVFTLLVEALARAGDAARAYALLNEMTAVGHAADGRLYALVFSAYAVGTSVGGPAPALLGGAQGGGERSSGIAAEGAVPQPDAGIPLQPAKTAPSAALPAPSSHHHPSTSAAAAALRSGWTAWRTSGRAPRRTRKVVAGGRGGGQATGGAGVAQASGARAGSVMASAARERDEEEQQQKREQQRAASVAAGGSSLNATSSVKAAVAIYGRPGALGGGGGTAASRGRRTSVDGLPEGGRRGVGGGGGGGGGAPPPLPPRPPDKGLRASAPAGGGGGGAVEGGLPAPRTEARTTGIAAPARLPPAAPSPAVQAPRPAPPAAPAPTPAPASVGGEGSRRNRSASASPSASASASASSLASRAAAAVSDFLGLHSGLAPSALGGHGSARPARPGSTAALIAAGRAPPPPQSAPARSRSGSEASTTTSSSAPPAQPPATPRPSVLSRLGDWAESAVGSVLDAAESLGTASSLAAAAEAAAGIGHEAPPEWQTGSIATSVEVAAAAAAVGVARRGGGGGGVGGGAEGENFTGVDGDDDGGEWEGSGEEEEEDGEEEEAEGEEPGGEDSEAYPEDSREAAAAQYPVPGGDAATADADAHLRTWAAALAFAPPGPTGLCPELLARFPGLQLDTSRVSCPECGLQLSARDVGKGWGLAAAAAAAGGGSRGGGGADIRTSCPACLRAEASSLGAPSAHRFVAHFAVRTGTEDAEGGGGGGLQVVEWLPPGAVARELLLQARPSGGSGLLLKGGASLHSREPVLFWNLVVLCGAKRLPSDFLLFLCA